MPKFHVERSVLIDAPIDQVKRRVTDFREWTRWSPWLLAEPNCKVEYGEDGRSYRWDGQIVGAGEMRIEQEEEGEIRFDLRFLRPWKSTSAVAFFFQAREEKTETTWTMDGGIPFFLFWMKRSMEAAIGMDYARGLALLKDLVEEGTAPSKLEFAGVERFEGTAYVGLRRACALDALGEVLPADMERVESMMAEAGLRAINAPLALYEAFDIVKGRTRYVLGYPVAEAPEAVPDGFLIGSMDAVDTYLIRHVGPYRHLGNAWAAAMMHGRTKQFTPAKGLPPFERYLSEVEAGDNAFGAVTEIRIPAKRP